MRRAFASSSRLASDADPSADLRTPLAQRTPGSELGGAAVKVLFATSEISPAASVGGLAVAAAGLVRALREADVDVTVVLPDYGDVELDDVAAIPLPVPAWAGPAVARRGVADGVGPITLVRAHGSVRPHPYTQPDGSGWPDNDRRFFAFSSAVAALAELEQPDVLHLNDWHTSAVLAFLFPRPPTVLTIHNLAYQGRTNPGWLFGFPHFREAFARDGDCNPLVGGIRLADVIVAVSPTYAREILTEESGMGVDGVLRARANRLVGILNGIDTTVWDPAHDPNLAEPYSWDDMGGKAPARRAVLDEMGLPDLSSPLLVMVSRLVAQKGVDLLLPALDMVERMPLQVAVLGDGDLSLAEALVDGASRQPQRVAFRHGYDERLSHALFAGGDLLAMPSRFEPCGLAQMQAMRYGTLPIVTDVGGLHDTVVDVDTNPREGTGVVADEPTPLALLDALHRGVRAHGAPARRKAMQKRGMAIDWSWTAPAREHLDLYQQLTDDRRSPA
jgi:starch synthase